MRPLLLFVLIQAGVAGFFWAAVIFELLGKAPGYAGVSLFCACAISLSTYLMARRL